MASAFNDSLGVGWKKPVALSIALFAMIDRGPKFVLAAVLPIVSTHGMLLMPGINYSTAYDTHLSSLRTDIKI